MDNLLDLNDQVEDAQPILAVETVTVEATTQHLADQEGVTSETLPVIEEIDTAPHAQAAKVLPGKAGTKLNLRREEPPPNPLLLDPYEWEQCTVTVGYTLLPDKKVSVSVHNHKDEPLVREFPAEEVPLPEKISSVMATLQRIWPTSPVNATVVLLPKPDSTPERPIIASVRVSTDTPVIQEGVESNLPFPAPISAMLEELKAVMPERALRNIERNAKAKTDTTVKPASRSSVSKPAAAVSAPTGNKNERKNQMTLF